MTPRASREREGGEYPPRDDMVAMIRRRLDVVVGTLQDLVRGIPMDVLDMLEDVPRARA